jgi:hypothetical protein
MRGILIFIGNKLFAKFAQPFRLIITHEDKNSYRIDLRALKHLTLG